MRPASKSNLLLLLVLLFTSPFSLLEVNALSYDYSASIECLPNPQSPQYGGGIIVNLRFDHELRGWSTFGYASLHHRQSHSGNEFAAARNRNQRHSSISQKTYLQKGKLYTFSAWIQVSSGGGQSVPVSAFFKTRDGSFVKAGVVFAQSGCWSMLKGGLTVNASSPTRLYFDTSDTSVDVFVDSVSLQPFTEKEWKSHHHQSIAKNRNRKVRIKAVDALGNPIKNATISLEQKSPSFPFGCAMNKNILTNIAYQNWFTSRFSVTTFENEMKWYATETSQGKEDYSVADAMLRFSQRHNVAVRGHNVVWEDPQYQLGWFKSLSKQQQALASFKRLFNVMNRYKGQVIAWDVVNENLHFDFFESKLGRNASAIFYNWATKADPNTTLFMNEFNTIEETGDHDSTPDKYLNKLKEIQAFVGNENSKMAIGLESHFRSPNLPYIRSAIDRLAGANLPIWVTELDVLSGPNQAKYLELILREVYGHPKIEGIVIWGAWRPEGCYRMCLTDNNFENLETGEVVDRLLSEWGLKKGGFVLKATTDGDGVFEGSLPHGDYEVKITHDVKTMEVSEGINVQGFNVAPSSSASKELLVVQVAA